MIGRFITALVLSTGLAAAQEVTTASAAILRTLDKVSGTLSDVEIGQGESAVLGRLQIMMHECRFPRGNPSGNAYAFLEINDTAMNSTVFKGWMVASSPALNALDDARYDVWVVRCKTS